MADCNNSRRYFLSNMAILSTGVLLGSPASVFSGSAKEAGLKEKWQMLWQAEGGNLEMLHEPLKDAAFDSICKGHRHETGSIINFPGENILAQPIWIYWGEKSNEPQDAIISFFTREEVPRQLCRINRFELESLYQLSGKKKEKLLAALLKENTIDANQLKQPGRLPMVKTMIQKGKQVRMITNFENAKRIFEQQFIYYT